MFWILDSIIMRSSNSSKSNSCIRRQNPVVTFKRKRQMIYLPLSNGDIPDIEEEDVPSDSNESLSTK